MIAYKFLLPGAVGPFSGYAWPTPSGGRPGPWVQAAGDVSACRSGVHACRIEHLPWWLQAELWEAEMAEPVRPVRHKLTAPSGRLVRRVAAWDAGAARDFAADCALRARDQAVAALEASAAGEAAARLGGCDGLDELLREARAIAPAVGGPERIAVTMAGDAAVRALEEAAAVTGYIAAHTARHVSGAEAMAAERRRQSAWLVGRLGLGAGS